LTHSFAHKPLRRALFALGRSAIEAAPAPWAAAAALHERRETNLSLFPGGGRLMKPPPFCANTEARCIRSAMQCDQSEETVHVEEAKAGSEAQQKHR
jgi:hypothetical protein